MKVDYRPKNLWLIVIVLVALGCLIAAMSTQGMVRGTFVVFTFATALLAVLFARIRPPGRLPKKGLFCISDIIEPRSLLDSLVSHSDPVSDYVWAHIPRRSRDTITDSHKDAMAKLQAVVDGLNAVVQGRSIIEISMFRGVTLSEDTRELLSRCPPRGPFERLNRMLLEDAYPRELARAGWRQRTILADDPTQDGKLTGRWRLLDGLHYEGIWQKFFWEGWGRRFGYEGGMPVSDDGLAPRQSIGSSSIRALQASDSSGSVPLDALVFKTLRPACERVQDGEWFVKVRFVLMNRHRYEVAIDDMHVRVYERQAKRRSNIFGPAMIGYGEEVLLAQDNTLVKAGRSYSILPGDGLELVLVLRISRFAGSPYFDTVERRNGDLDVVFGILVDYYGDIGTGEIARATTVSDCVYYVSGDHKLGNVTIEAVDSRSDGSRRDTEGLSSVRMSEILAEHMSYRPKPKP